MKFNFKIQQYQTDAVDSVVNCFKGQPYIDNVSYRRDIGNKREMQTYSQMLFVNNYDQETLDFTDDFDESGFKNENLLISSDMVLSNIKEVQQNNNVMISDSLVDSMGACSLDIEMETGTGKTYVYIKTMFELNKHYGWSKFIVVVPSIAIREGVKKSFEITQDHFMEHYGKKARFFVYNSSNLNQLDSFSCNAGINVMIINMQAFNTSMKEGGKSKEARIIYDKRDEFGSRRPIDVIKANNPIIILDEPQKMGGDATQKALKNFNPLFTLNYSATHAKHHNLVYALDAVDAYNQHLVKKIEVKGFQVKNFRGTDHYLYLEDIIISPKHAPRARIEYEKDYRTKGINHESRIFDVDDNLYEISNNMEQYKGYRVSEIDPIAGTVTFTNGEVIHRGDVVGDVSEKDMRRVQIRETIKSHLEKEEELFNRGIKTLSLLFIDEVAKYRRYDEDGEEILGEYGQIFEQEYNDIVNEYITVFDTPYQKYLKGIDVKDTHKGYFSIDKKGHAVDSTVKRGSYFSDDISAYDLIFKNKERLLSFAEPTRFIFSYSALREGWDNPNVFQTLWGYINHKYAYTVSFDSNELIKKAIDAIDAELYVSMLQYTTSISEQKYTLSADAIKSGDSFKGAKSDTTALKHFETSQIKYDLIGKVAEATVLTRRTVAAILKGIRKDKFDMYKNNPEEFISKVTRLIKEQKATMIVDHISYDQLEGKYDSEIFTAEKHTTIDKAFKAEKHIQPYVFTDGNADKSVERKFAEDLDGAAEVCVYAKLPKGFSIPTPVGNYSPDWAIAFNEGTVKHIFFVAETKGTMESMQLRPIEKAKIMCARRLFNEISTDNVVYHDVDSYQSLLNIMNDPSLDKKVCE